jgi:4-hydroxy-tetrahydrodipicolinate synthase
MIKEFNGCYTASITPMHERAEVDYEGLERLVEFQTSQGVSGILAVGTTGESPTLTWDEHNKVIKMIHEYNNDRTVTIAGTGSNSTLEAMESTHHAVNAGIEAILLVEPYYNGPSSLEIRREYIDPIASRFPSTQIIPYVIPGRTGTQLLPEDLGILYSELDNLRAVKEATGNLENMMNTRRCCGEDFDILSGDDDLTYNMMTSEEIGASGVISVASNVVPGPIQEMVEHILSGRILEATRFLDALKPLFEIVTVKTIEETMFGAVPVKSRNPVPYKTLMNVLGMPSGPVRKPLGKMTGKGMETILKAVRTVYRENPWVLTPIEEFFDVDLSERLFNEKYWMHLFYD